MKMKDEVWGCAPRITYVSNFLQNYIYTPRHDIYPLLHALLPCKSSAIFWHLSGCRQVFSTKLVRLRQQLLTYPASHRDQTGPSRF